MCLQGARDLSFPFMAIHTLEMGLSGHIVGGNPGLVVPRACAGTTDQPAYRSRRISGQAKWLRPELITT